MHEVEGSHAAVLAKLLVNTADRRETIFGCSWDCMRWESGPALTGR